MKTELTAKEINDLPNLQEVVEQVLGEEKKIWVNSKPPQAIVGPFPSVIHTPMIEYFNDYDEHKFIAVRLCSRDPLHPEKFALKPNLKNRVFLFRGQSGFYNPSTPSLFRKNKERFVVENIFYEEFVMALKDHPLVRLFCDGIEIKGHHYFFEMNYYGLAQHYGLKTGVMDLTSDIEVAKFFAATDYDEINDAYTPVLDDSRYGVLYYWNNVRDPFAFQIRPDGGNLSTIGLQVFPRSGKQSGFLFSMSRSQNFNECPFIKYKFFRHNSSISKKIFVDAKNGQEYFPNDELSSLSQRIRASNILSGEAFLANLAFNPNDNRDRNYSDCKAVGVEIDFNKPHISFNHMEKALFVTKIKSGFWQNFCNQIIFPNDSDGRFMDEFLGLPANPKYKRYFEWE